MADSPLVTKYIQAYSGNFTKGRSRYSKIKEITIHHCAGIMSIDDLGRLWQRVGRNGSSHYGVSGSQVGQYVREADIAWTNSNWEANCRAVTIETSNSGGAPNWPVADDTLETLVKLVADIAKRNNLGTLVPGKNLTWHSMYSATACPGPYLSGKISEIAAKANQINSNNNTNMEVNDDMQFLEVFGTKNCQCFTAPNVDAVDTSYNGGSLKSGEVYPIVMDTGSDGTYQWLKCYIGGATRYVAVISDRCKIVMLSAGDAVQACIRQGIGTIDTAQIEELTKRAETAEAIAASYLKAINTAKSALEV